MANMNEFKDISMVSDCATDAAEAIADAAIGGSGSIMKTLVGVGVVGGVLAGLGALGYFIVKKVKGKKNADAATGEADDAKVVKVIDVDFEQAETDE